MIDPQDEAKRVARLWQSLSVPLDSEERERVRERKIVPALGDAIVRAARGSRAARPSRRLFAAIAIAAAAALALAGAAVFRRAPSPRAAAELGGVQATAGVVTLVRGSQPAVVQRSRLQVGDRLATAAGAAAEVRLGALVVASVSGSSALAVSRPERTTQRLRLEHGRIDARVDDRPSPLPKLVVETPVADVVVTGTTFNVEVVAGLAGAAPVTRVAVEKGRVVVRRGAVVLATVNGHETWSSAPAPIEPPKTDVAPPVPEAAPKADVRSAAARKAPAAVQFSPEAPPSGTLAEENSIFQRAVDARKRGNYYAALDSFEELLVRYPVSPLALEARLERMRILSRLGRTQEAQREAERYLGSAENGAAREEAERIASPPAP